MTDPRAFEDFVGRYQNLVYGTAVRLLGDPGEAEDISQSVFLRAFQRFDKVRGDSAAGWLRTVTRNLCLNHLTRYRARLRPIREVPGHPSEAGRALENSIISGATQISDLQRKEEHARLEAALWSLPAHQRVPLVLFHFEDFSYRAIADQLGISLGKVKTDIHRGRLALRALVRTEDEDR